MDVFKLRNGAVEKTRTSTRLLPQRPQRCASTNSATTARPEPEGMILAAGGGGNQAKQSGDPLSGVGGGAVGA